MNAAPLHPASQAAAARGARQAWRRGQAALRDGALAEALRWLDRACRLAPDDALFHLGLATAWLPQDPAHAARLFTALTARHDTWQAWFGLAAACQQSGDVTGARAALARALGGFPAPLDSEWTALADRIAPDGWCAVTADFRLRHGPAGLPAPDVRVDGHTLRERSDPIDRLRRPDARFLTVQRMGRAAVGSPVDLALLRERGPQAEPSRAPRPVRPSRRAGPPPPRIPRPRPVDIVVPVYRDAAATMACLASVLAARPRGTRVIVVDDATPEPALAQALDRLAARGRIVLRRHGRNRGFPAAANAGMALARADGHDVVVLNADTLVGRAWVTRLRAAAYAAADIGTACPLSNNATILSYPDPGGGNPMPDRAQAARLANLAWASNGPETVEIPTAVGFCMYVRHDCLRATGQLRTDAFGRGYGEENDFCARATAAGWRHVAAPGVFVAHAGAASFGASGGVLQARHAEILARLHPDYPARVAAHVAADPLWPARRRLDMALWQAGRPPASPGVLLITHALGGGVAASVAQRVATIRDAGGWPIVLSPVKGADQTVRIEGFPNLRFTLPNDRDLLTTTLRAGAIGRVEFHHTLGHPRWLLDLPRAMNWPYTVHVHDYHWLCPRLVLAGHEGRYCGEPDLAGCVACIRRRGSLLEEPLSVGALRARSAALFGAAVAVIAPSADTAARVSRYFPAIIPVVVPPTDISAAASPVGLTPHDAGRRRRRVAVIGAIGPAKGCHVLLDLAREAASSDLDLEFVVVGHTTLDTALLRTGRVFISGPYRADEAVSLIRAQQADLALLPSVVPETWCHALTEIWASGLRVLAFDLGAQAERIRASGLGWLLPLGLPARSINRALLAARW